MATPAFKPPMTVGQKDEIHIATNFGNLDKFIRELNIPVPNLKFFYREPSPDDTFSPTTTSSTFVDLQGMTLNINVSNGGFLVLFGSSVFQTATVAAEISMGISVNGVDLANTKRTFNEPVAAYNETIFTSWIGAVGAGSYLVKLRWLTGATVAGATALGRQRSIMAILLDGAS